MAEYTWIQLDLMSKHSSKYIVSEGVSVTPKAVELLGTITEWLILLYNKLTAYCRQTGTGITSRLYVEVLDSVCNSQAVADVTSSSDVAPAVRASVNYWAYDSKSLSFSLHPV